MPQIAEREYSHIGETQRAQDHDRDLVHELSKRLDAVWRMDQYVANADGKPELQQFWRQLKQQECQAVDRLKELISKEVRSDCF
jgi:protoheme ferro-lyase